MPKVLGGLTPRSTELAANLLATLTPHVHLVSSPRAAEMTKLLENIFRSVNIALVNELALLCERMEIDIWEVIDAAKTKPFGYMPFYPGAGVGSRPQLGAPASGAGRAVAKRRRERRAELRRLQTV